jgi:tetrapyrrole methylase family protein/MazG family protein
MIDYQQKEKYGFADLVDLVALLRGADGCPWDREQTHESIRRNFLEEAYEAVEAIDLGDSVLLKEELGDVLLQVVFHALMEQEAGRFGVDEVCDGVCRKLVARHPHIFGEVRADTADQVLQNWDEIKKKEKNHKNTADVLEGVAGSLPALIRAEKVQHKAAKAGYDWDNIAGILDKAEEELAELRGAIAANAGREALEAELGDLLFTAVNAARFLEIDPETALERCTRRFIRRVAAFEAHSGGRTPQDMDQREFDERWEAMKNTLRAQEAAQEGTMPHE